MLLIPSRIMILSLVTFPLCAQTDAERVRQVQQEKLELILRFQDLRTVHDSKLVSFLSDRDPVVRERATRSFGSIQDTTVIPLLVERLSDRDTNVQRAVAFAIGQTAGQLSEQRKQRLEHDLIWARVDLTAVPERMIEEIGKFGTPQALQDLILRFGSSYPLPHVNGMMMAIARFAIRGITSMEAVRYLVRFTKPADATPWQAMFALQRIGDNEETRHELDHLVLLYKHSDPVVRMHLATLLGKIRDERTSLEPLQRLAEFDADWRVRVNALKALAGFDLRGKDDIIRTFYRAFSNENLHVASTAVSSFGEARVQDSGQSAGIELLERIALNREGHYPWQLQGEAAIAFAKIRGPAAFRRLGLTSWPQPKLQAQMLTALAYTGAAEAREVLVKVLDDKKPQLYRAALAALQTLVHERSGDSVVVQETYDTCVRALGSDDVAVITTAANVLGDSLFLRPASVDPLIAALATLRVPDDVEAMQEIVVTLGKLNDPRAVDALAQNMRQRDRSVALASVSALKSITGIDYSPRLPRSFEPLFTDFDFRFLRSLPDTIPVTLETIRGEVMMELYKNVAPFTVLGFVKLARRGFYRGLVFHRVVPNFVVQGGDPRGDGWGGPGYSIRSEFSDITYDEGALGIPSAGKDTEGSQFFITQSPQPHLDGRYTLFGRVVSGMDVVNRIQVEDRIFDVKSPR